ncbi:MAG TPA: hypothetical protein V6D17_01770 [Candidatus Obscuribacterales bacterium]
MNNSHRDASYSRDASSRSMQDSPSVSNAQWRPDGNVHPGFPRHLQHTLRGQSRLPAPHDDMLADSQQNLAVWGTLSCDILRDGAAALHTRSSIYLPGVPEYGDACSQRQYKSLPELTIIRGCNSSPIVIQTRYGAFQLDLMMPGQLRLRRNADGCFPPLPRPVARRPGCWNSSNNGAGGTDEGSQRKPQKPYETCEPYKPNRQPKLYGPNTPRQPQNADEPYGPNTPRQPQNAYEPTKPYPPPHPSRELPERNQTNAGWNRQSPGDVSKPLENSWNSDNPSEAKETGFPPRNPAASMGGSQFFRKILKADPNNPDCTGITGWDRERAILAQIEAGNIPDILRHPKKIVVADKHGNKAEISVLPDYLAIGTNEDYVRVPVTPLLAKAIAEKYGYELPTKKLADDIYLQSDVRLSGVGLVRDRSDTQFMQGNGFYLQHDSIIDRQLPAQAEGSLIAGHKKDIIVSRFAKDHPSKLDFYGLFDKNGKPIQGAGGGAHGVDYVDYSHGARFIAKDVIVNGRPMKYEDVLKDPTLCGLLSDEGPLDVRPIYRSHAFPG